MEHCREPRGKDDLFIFHQTLGGSCQQVPRQEGKVDKLQFLNNSGLVSRMKTPMKTAFISMTMTETNWHQKKF